MRQPRAVIDLNRYRGHDVEPLLLLVDLQQEFVAEGRLLQIQSVAPALENCRRLLDHARACKWSIAHARWMQRGPYFNEAMPYSGWIDGFEPHGSEMVFNKTGPSCYSAPNFAEMMATGISDNTIIAGLTGAVSCLATVVEGASNNHRYTFVTDASASHACETADEYSAHDQACFIASHHVRTTTTSDIIGCPAPTVHHLPDQRPRP
ncbi:MAG: cysteine hydrolase family protein [Phreatobacter sp.]